MQTSLGTPVAPGPAARLFIAIAIPPPAQAAIAGATAGLRATAGSAVRWTDPASVHLTLRFLGVTPGDAIPRLHEALGTAAACAAPFTLHIAGAGAFPSPARARVLWLGTEPNTALAALYHAVDDACATAALGRELRPFRAHLTVGRPRPGAPRLDDNLARVGFVAALRVDSFHLMASDLTRAGARHTRLASFPLGASPAAPAPSGAR